MRLLCALVCLALHTPLVISSRSLQQGRFTPQRPHERTHHRTLQSSAFTNCVDTYPACPGWVGQCAVPGVATYCPCMCGVTPGPSTPSPGPSPSPIPSSSLSPSPIPSTSLSPSPKPSSPTPASPAPGCVDTYPACPGWVGQCSTPGVSTYCPCMCSGAGGAPSGSSPSPTPTPTPSPSPAPVTSPSPAPQNSPIPPPPTPASPAPAGAAVFSPYKDTSINMNWNTNVISTKVTGTLSPLTQVMPAGLSAITLAFATGECGSESWGGTAGAALASANIPTLIAARKRYILSTGGAAGAFTCGTTAGFMEFLNRYISAYLIGVDFDIEAGQSQSDVDNLVARVKEAQPTYPNLRFSFTLATLPTALGTTADLVMQRIRAAGLSKYYVNLMVMDYGDAACTRNTATGQCDMGQSAIDAANMLHTNYGVPYSQIELTPMIGGNDVITETFTLADAATISSFALTRGLAGIHFWSFDRDVDCLPGYAAPTCNTYGLAGTLGFTKKFLQSLPGW